MLFPSSWAELAVSLTPLSVVFFCGVAIASGSKFLGQPVLLNLRNSTLFSLFFTGMFSCFSTSGNAYYFCVKLERYRASETVIPKRVVVLGFVLPVLASAALVIGSAVALVIFSTNFYSGAWSPIIKAVYAGSVNIFTFSLLPLPGSLLMLLLPTRWSFPLCSPAIVGFFFAMGLYDLFIFGLSLDLSRLVYNEVSCLLDVFTCIR